MKSNRVLPNIAKYLIQKDLDLDLRHLQEENESMQLLELAH